MNEAQEDMNTILSWFGKGDLAKAKKELADKDEEIAGLNKRHKEPQAEKARLQERHKLEIGKLRDGYQTMMWPKSISTGKSRTRNLSMLCLNRRNK